MLREECDEVRQNITNNTTKGEREKTNLLDVLLGDDLDGKLLACDLVATLFDDREGTTARIAHCALRIG